MDVATIRPDVLARFWSKVNPCGPVHPTLRTECWLWAAAIGPDGYGCFWALSSMVKAHRFAYESSVGPIQVGLQIDHLCRVRSCVNPSHLEPVTQRENIMRGTSPSAMHARKTHCPNGHTYEGGNLYLNPSGSRACRACRACRRKAPGESRHA